MYRKGNDYHRKGLEQKISARDQESGAVRGIAMERKHIDLVQLARQWRSKASNRHGKANRSLGEGKQTIEPQRKSSERKSEGGALV